MLIWILLALLAVYLAGIAFLLLAGGTAGWRAALAWPVIVVAFALFWRRD